MGLALIGLALIGLALIGLAQWSVGASQTLRLPGAPPAQPRAGDRSDEVAVLRRPRLPLRRRSDDASPPPSLV